MKKYIYRNILRVIFVIGVMISSNVSATIITTYTNQIDWENALSAYTIVTENFDGAASDFGSNSSGNTVGTLSIDIIGHEGDGTRQGLDGNGFFEGEVDSSDITSSDGATIRFNLISSFGFSLIGLKDNSVSSPDLNVHEFGIQLLGESFLLSDLLGLTGPTDTSAPDNQVSFIGFVSDTEFTSFNLVHGNLIRSVSGNNEDFLLDALAYGSSTSVPEPTSLALLGLGLAGFGFSRKKKKA